MAEPARWQRSVEEFVLGQIGAPPVRVLEIGCGKGELARTLARAGHCVTAIDPRAPEGPIFRRVKIEEFSDPDPFDHVVASLSLHHVEDLGMALDKVANLLRAGGALVVVEFACDRFDEATAEWAMKHLPAASSSSGDPRGCRSAIGDGCVEVEEPGLPRKLASPGGRARRGSTAPGGCVPNSNDASSNASLSGRRTYTRTSMMRHQRRTSARP
jgi:SAM-dependent methyltransferase